MVEPQSLAKLVPGFEFLQNLVRSAGAAVPGMGQWIAPTLDPVELERRIDELKAVQFWLEQNARMLGTTIQALEVQRMTLSTLQTMNVQMSDLRGAMKIAPATTRPAAASTSDAPARSSKGRAASAAGEAPAPGAPAVDPMQWWTALTKQFTDIASQAMKESATVAASATKSAPAAQAGSASGAGDAPQPAPADTPARARAARPRAGTSARSRAAGSGNR